MKDIPEFHVEEKLSPDIWQEIRPRSRPLDTGTPMMAALKDLETMWEAQRPAVIREIAPLEMTQEELERYRETSGLAEAGRQLLKKLQMKAGQDDPN